MKINTKSGLYFAGLLIIIFNQIRHLITASIRLFEVAFKHLSQFYLISSSISSQHEMLIII